MCSIFSDQSGPNSTVSGRSSEGIIKKSPWQPQILRWSKTMDGQFTVMRILVGLGALCGNLRLVSIDDNLPSLSDLVVVSLLA